MTFKPNRLAIWAASFCIVAVLALAGAVYALSLPSRAILDSSATGLPVETVAIDSPSGARLAGWYLPGAAGKGCVLLMHGVRGNRMSQVARMRFLNLAGYSVLSFDFQAHGESQGTSITFGRLESLDARAATAWLRAKLPGQKIGALGISLGGASALIGPEPLEVDALVLESVYPDINHAIGDRLQARLGLLGKWITPAFILTGRFVTGLDPAQLRPIDGLAKLKVPVFILSGTADPNTPIQETRDMFAAAHAPKRLWEVEGAGHVDLGQFAGQAYRDRILAFFKEML